MASTSRPVRQVARRGASRRQVEGFGRGRQSRSMSSDGPHGGGALSTSTTASTRPGGWIGRSSISVRARGRDPLRLGADAGGGHAVVGRAADRALCDCSPAPARRGRLVWGQRSRLSWPGKEIDAYQIIDLSWGDGQAKSPLYSALLRSMMETRSPGSATQAPPGRDRGQRADSLALACEADALAHRAGADQ